DYNNKKWDDAREHLSLVAQSDINSIRPTAKLYLAQLASQTNDAGGAVRNYNEAREIASEQVKDVFVEEQTKLLAQHVVASVDRSLWAYNKDVFLAYVGL